MVKKLTTLVSIFGAVLLSAQTLHYKVYSPVIGKLGKITLKINESGDSYEMVGEAKTTGMAKMLTKKRRDKYISKGRIKNGKYISDKFIMEKKNKKKKEIVEYSFDHKNRKVIKHKRRWKHGKQDKDSSKPLKYFASTDLASLFHNAVLELKPGTQKDYTTVGAEKIKGHVTVAMPSEKVARNEKKALEVPQNLKIVHVSTKEEIEGKRNRTAIFAVDNSGVIHKGYLEAIPVVGKVYIELKK